jgi:hypothetical protein
VPPVGQLFDLERDPGELTDLAGDPAFRASLPSMQRLKAHELRGLVNEVAEPAWLPEEPWKPRAQSKDGFGPGFPASER